MLVVNSQFRIAVQMAGFQYTSWNVACECTGLALRVKEMSPKCRLPCPNTIDLDCVALREGEVGGASRLGLCDRSLPTAYDDAPNALSGLFRVFMLPDPDAHPAGFSQYPVCFAVSFDIALQFRLPVVRVGLRIRGMDRAAVPEASIHKDSNLRGPEDDVRGTAYRFQRTGVYAVSEAHRMDQAPQFQFGRRVPRAISQHRPANRLAAGPGRPGDRSPFSRLHADVVAVRVT